jgi:esterase/lipase superfamily enzyme
VTLRIAAALVALSLLAGCTSTVRLMPTPTVLTTADAGLAPADPDPAPGTKIEILYATNRVPIGPPGARNYTRMRSSQLRVGVATLQVGDDPVPAGAGRAKPAANAPAERPAVRLRAIRPVAVLDDGSEGLDPDAAAFFAYVDELVSRGGNRDVLIYVHGANSSFERAAAQAAQFQHFLGRDAVVMLFAWPSAGTWLRYRLDVATAGRTVPEFAYLLEKLSAHTNVAQLNVLAYSAGSMIASPGLARAVDAATAAGDPARLRLGEIYYAAPDIDFPVFVENLPRYQGQTQRVTVALNTGDRALSFSQWIHRVSRAGRPNLDEIGPEETQWLADASARNELDVLAIRPADLPGLPASSHSFWYDHPWVSSDMVVKLQFHATPPARGLDANRTRIDIAFWTFPPDYPSRLSSLVRDLAAGKAP